MVVDLADKQALLAEPDAVRRLAAERALLAKETGMLRGLTSAPAAGAALLALQHQLTARDARPGAERLARSWCRRHARRRGRAGWQR